MGVKGSPLAWTWQMRHSGTVDRLRKEADQVRYALTLEEARLALVQLRETAEILARSLNTPRTKETNRV